ncbi:unnamed protein product, partial [Ascophyllum nodosum]
FGTPLPLNRWPPWNGRPLTRWRKASSTRKCLTILPRGPPLTKQRLTGNGRTQTVAAPLRAQLATLDRHYTTECHGLQDSATAIKEMTRTHMEREARVASFKAQKQSTAATLARAERIQASFLAGFSAQQPAPPLSAVCAASAAQPPRARAHLTTSVASAARQSPASANLATLVAPLSHSLWLWAPPRFQRLPPRRVRSVPQLLPQPGLWYPLPTHLRRGTPCNRRLPGNSATLRAPHPGRSWSRGHIANPNRHHTPQRGMLVT